MSPRLRVAGRSPAHHAPRPAADPARPALITLYAVGALPGYLAPAVVGRLVAGAGLTATRAGALGSTLLLASAVAGLALAGRVTALGQARTARAGLLLLLLGCPLAGTGGPGRGLQLLVGCLLAGLGAGTTGAAAATGIAAAPEPHRLSVRGLLATSGTAGLLYLVLPRLGRAPALPFLALGLLAALAFPLTMRLPAARCGTARTARPCRLPRRGPGLALAGGLVLWSLAQNALWGISAQIGLHQAGLTERRIGLVLALALGGGLLGVLGAGALGDRLGRALPVGAGTAAIALCVALTAGCHSAAVFAGGEVLWNGLYPLVLSYLLGTAAALDPAGRWTVLAGAACTLGLVGGPLTGALLSGALPAGGVGGAPVGAVLGGALLLTAVPLTLAARAAGTRPVIPAQRRG